MRKTPWRTRCVDDAQDTRKSRLHEYSQPVTQFHYHGLGAPPAADDDQANKPPTEMRSGQKPQDVVALNGYEPDLATGDQAVQVSRDRLRFR
jgi:hypothetical protein